MSESPEQEERCFEVALRQVALAVERLESGELGLDEALGHYQDGVKLLRHCYRLLEGAERTVALLTGVDATGNPMTAPFDATATAERETPATAPSNREPVARPGKSRRSPPA